MGFSSLQEKVLKGQNKSPLLLCCHEIPLHLHVPLAPPSSSASSLFQCSDLSLKEQKNPRGIEKDPQISLSSGLGFGRAELQNCNTAPFLMKWGNHWDTSPWDNNFFLLFLLSAALVGHWQLFFIGFGQGFSLVGAAGMAP